jgi:hypothetical protein
VDKPEIANIIKEELQKIQTHQSELHQGCAACHVIFSLKNKLASSEQDCADLLSEVLTENPTLNQQFIEVVEQIHMSERHLGGAFTLRDRESKDAYLEAYFANVLDELGSDLNHYSHKMLLRKLLLAYLGLYIAQTIRVDYHAATEEIYYLLRKNAQRNSQLDEIISKIESKIKQDRFTSD